MRKFLKTLWIVFVERCKVHAALRRLSKQEWSIEFLTALLVRAANVTGKPLIMEIQSPSGYVYRVSTVDNQVPPALADDNIFNHLDDEAAVKAFMEQINK